MILFSGLLFLFLAALSSTPYAATISGTVMDSEGAAITGDGKEIDVNIYTGSPCSEYEHIFGTSTNTTTGQYTITGLSPGTYYVRT